MDPAGRFLRLFRRERRWTRELVAALPEATFAWRPAEGAFSCGELVRHLILAERFWRRLLVEAVAERRYDPFGYEGSGRERHEAFRGRNLASAQREGELTSYAACLAHWLPVQAETEAAFAAFTADQLDAVEVHHPIAGLSAPLGDMLHYFLSHEIHHRGQLSAYAKALGLRQPPVLAEV